MQILALILNFLFLPILNPSVSCICIFAVNQQFFALPRHHCHIFAMHCPSLLANTCQSCCPVQALPPSVHHLIASMQEKDCPCLHQIAPCILLKKSLLFLLWLWPFNQSLDSILLFLGLLPWIQNQT